MDLETAVLVGTFVGQLVGSTYSTHIFLSSMRPNGAGAAWDPQVAHAAAVNDTEDLMTKLEQKGLDAFIKRLLSLKAKIDAEIAAKQAKAAPVPAPQPAPASSPPAPVPQALPAAPVVMQTIASPAAAPASPGPIAYIQTPNGLIPVMQQIAQLPQVGQSYVLPPQAPAVQAPAAAAPATLERKKASRDEIREKIERALGHRLNGGEPAMGETGGGNEPPLPAAPVASAQYAALAAYEQALKAQQAQNAQQNGQQQQNRPQPAHLTDAPEGFSPAELRAMGVGTGQ